MMSSEDAFSWLIDQYIQEDLDEYGYVMYREDDQDVHG